jgi:GR25 family glycosyltransferase involved in LPS biosynthesis
MNSTLCIFFLLPVWGFGSLEDHFKAIDINAAFSQHSLRSIDFIYMINLDQRPEKWEKSIRQLEPYDIHPYRFSAINGWEDLTVEMINDVGLKYSLEMEGGFMATSYPTFEPSHEIIQNLGQSYFVHCMARGTIGCFLSHLSILQDAYDRGFETIWVMEDDIEVLRNPHELSSLIENLDSEVGKGNWDVLYTDKDMKRADGAYIPCWSACRRPDMTQWMPANNFAIRERVGSFYRIGSRYGTHSMIIRRCGMKKLLSFFRAHQIYFPYDMDMIFPYGIRFYTVVDDVVGNLPKAPSDNGGPFYKFVE